MKENLNFLKILKVIIMVSFIITIFTSIPLFINYLKSSSNPPRFLVDFHVWFGMVCLIFIVVRMANKKFMKLF
jgi:cytochrome b561